jgi:DNA-binding protein HU-beta
MNKAMLIEALSRATDAPKSDSKDFLEAFVTVVGNALKKGEEVSISGFGTFEAADRKARKGVNPATGKPMSIPAKRVPKFRAGKALKDQVQKK